MHWFDIVAIGLGAWRVSVFVTSGAGPWNVMIRVREAFDVEHDSDGYVEANPAGGMGKLLTCVWCFSLWAVVVLSAVVSFAPWPVHVLAAWGIVGVIQEIIDRD